MFDNLRTARPPQRGHAPAVAPPNPDSAYGAPARGGYTFYSAMQVALQIPRPLPSTRPAVCPALRFRISGNASATRTPCSRARCRDGSPCPADLVPVKMSAAPDGGTGIAEALRKTGLRRAPGASRKSGRYPASRVTSGIAAMDSISVIHSTLRAKPVFSTQKAPPAPGQRLLCHMHIPARRAQLRAISSSSMGMALSSSPASSPRIRR